MKHFLLIIISISSMRAMGQDTLSTRFLSEVIVQSVQTETDTLQNFYRSNLSANTEDILSRMNGIYLIRRSAYGQEPIVRGMSGGQINITIDGMHMFSACTDKMDPVTIYVEPQNLKSIDASLGTNGNKMGSTIGGSINLNLAEPKLGGESFTGRTGTGFQSVSNGFNYYTDANFSKPQSAYQASFIYRKSQNYIDGLGQRVDFSQYEKTNFSVAGKWKLNKDTLKANFLIDEGRKIGFPALPMDVGKAQASIYAFSYIRHTSSGWLTDFQAKVYANEIHHQMDDSQREVLIRMDMPGRSRTFGTFLEGSMNKLRNHHIKLRTDFYYHRMVAEMVMYTPDSEAMYMQTWPASSRAVTGWYVSDDIKLPGQVRFNLNVRLDISNTALANGIGKDQLEVFYPSLRSSIPNVTKSFNATFDKLMLNKLKFTLHGGYGERLPTNAELFGFYLFNRQDIHDYMGNPNLRMEKSLTSDVGIKYFNPWLELSTTVFYQKSPQYILAYVDSELDPMTPGAQGVKVYRNIANADFWGVEFAALAAPMKHLQLISNFKGTRANTSEGNPLPFIPAFKNVSTVRFEKHQLSGQVEWEGALPQTNAATQFGEVNTKGYSLINIRSGYQLHSRFGMILINVGIENLLNRYYREHLDWGGIPRPGRNYYCSVELKF